MTQEPTLDPRHAIGANNPPLYDPDVFAAMQAKVTELADAAGAWSDLGQIATDEQAQMLTDFVASATKIEKAIEEARVAAKKPHADAAKAVDDAFKRPATIAARVKDIAKKLLTGFLQKKQAEEAEERRRNAAEAQKAADDAARAAAIAAANNDVAGAVDAEEAAADAAKEIKAAAKPVNTKVASYTGAGRTIALRTTRHARITNQNAVYMAFRDHPDVMEVLQRLATAAIRRDETVTGAEPYIVESAA